MGESRSAYKMLVGRPEGKRLLGRPRRGWEDNIKMDLRKMGYDGRDLINLAQDRDRWRAYVRVAVNLRILQKPFGNENNRQAWSETFGNILDTLKTNFGVMMAEGEDDAVRTFNENPCVVAEMLSVANIGRVSGRKRRTVPEAVAPLGMRANTRATRGEGAGRTSQVHKDISVGNTPCDRHELKTWVSGFDIGSIIILSVLVVIPSTPGATLFFKVLAIVIISLSLTGNMNIDDSDDDGDDDDDDDNDDDDG
ncbi:hypothetical protein ANN_19182 [Periplaneta americana]|uniref:Uncharacterized protein n=1 Tax=Periplaneta americana TaxID=6978 RepID=A0ABQ8S9P9_PERAM|nr:hypothetical protein ANN_19182 [Periplaneta americana]